MTHTGTAPQQDNGETIQILLDLLNPLHNTIDRQLPEQFTDEREWDAPDDREYNVNITARMERDLTQAVLILENRRAALHANPAGEGRSSASDAGAGRELLPGEAECDAWVASLETTALAGREAIALVCKDHIDSALRWHEVFEDGRGGNNLTREQTSDLICSRLTAALALAFAPQHGDIKGAGQ